MKNRSWLLPLSFGFLFACEAEHGSIAGQSQDLRRWVQVERAWGGDQDGPFYERVRYDSRGRLTQRDERTVARVGVYRRLLHHRYEQQEITSTEDIMANGSIDRTRRYLLGAEGRLLRLERYEEGARGRFGTNVVYDAQGRPTAIIEEGGPHTEVTYDARGNLTAKFVDGEQQAAWTWDEAGRLSTETRSGLVHHAFSYDSWGRLSRATTTRGEQRSWTQYGYDPLGRLELRSTGTENGPKLTTRYAYDAWGRLLWERTKDEETGAAEETRNVSNAEGQRLRQERWVNGILEGTVYYEYRVVNEDRVEVTRSFSAGGPEVRLTYQRMETPSAPPELPALQPDRVWPAPADSAGLLLPL